MARSMLLLCLLAAAVSAQEEPAEAPGPEGEAGAPAAPAPEPEGGADYDPANPYGSEPSSAAGDKQGDFGGGGAEGEYGPSGSEPKASSGPMPLEDARINFGTVVRTYLAKEGGEDYWTPRGARDLRLTLDSVDEKSIQQVGGQLFKGRAVFLEARGGRVEVGFTVDFSGSKWRVEEVGPPRVLKAKTAARRPAASPGSSYAAALARHVRAIARKRGAFRVKDGALNKTWKLRLVRVPPDRVTDLGGGRWRACAEFREIGGPGRLDLDFTGVRAGAGWRFQRVLIHAVDGAPRHDYDEKGEPVPPAPPL